MSTEQDKAKVTRFIDEIINQNRWDRAEEYVSPSAVDHLVPPGLPQNLEGSKQFFGMLRAAFPDFKYTIQDTVGEGDLIAQRVTGEGTMKGSFLGMPATGKHAQWDELHIVRMQDGKVVEHWGSVDQMSMLMQLGLASMPGGPATHA